MDEINREIGLTAILGEGSTHTPIDTEKKEADRV
jgi:hypothetical protein